MAEGARSGTQVVHVDIGPLSLGARAAARCFIKWLERHTSAEGYGTFEAKVNRGRVSVIHAGDTMDERLLVELYGN